MEVQQKSQQQNNQLTVQQQQQQSQRIKLSIAQLRNDMRLMDLHTETYIQGIIIGGFDKIKSDSSGQLFLNLKDQNEDNVQLAFFDKKASQIFKMFNQSKGINYKIRFQKGKPQIGMKGFEIKGTKNSIVSILQKPQIKSKPLQSSNGNSKANSNNNNINSMQIQKEEGLTQQMVEQKYIYHYPYKYQSGPASFDGHKIITIKEVKQNENKQNLDHGYTYYFILNCHLKCRFNTKYVQHDRNKFFKAKCFTCRPFFQSKQQNKCIKCNSQNFNVELSFKVEVNDDASHDSLAIYPKQRICDKLLGYESSNLAYAEYQQNIDEFKNKLKALERKSSSIFLLIKARYSNGRWYYNGDKIYEGDEIQLINGSLARSCMRNIKKMLSSSQQKTKNQSLYNSQKEQQNKLQIQNIQQENKIIKRQKRDKQSLNQKDSNNFNKKYNPKFSYINFYQIMNLINEKNNENANKNCYNN